MSQKNLEFPEAKIVSKPAFLIVASITYSQKYYEHSDVLEAGYFGSFGSPKNEYKYQDKYLGVVDNEVDGQEIISRLDPEKHFHLSPYKIDKVVCRLIPVTRYTLEE